MATHISSGSVSSGANAEPSKSLRLRALLEGPDMGFLMEAHDGLSAKIAEEAGFSAVWASGLSMSAALGVRDSNEADWPKQRMLLQSLPQTQSLARSR